MHVRLICYRTSASPAMWCTMLRAVSCIFLVCSLLCGCVSPLEKYSPYSAIAGREVVVCREAFLYRCYASPDLGLDMWIGGHSTNAVCLVSSDPRRWTYHLFEKIHILQPGQPLLIDRIDNVINEGFATVEVRGRVSIGGTDKKFIYQWGEGGELERAPWENDSVPASRQIRRDGRLRE